MKLHKPDPKHIRLPKDWRYVKAEKTDIAATIRRAKKRLDAAQEGPNDQLGNKVCRPILGLAK